MKEVHVNYGMSNDGLSHEFNIVKEEYPNGNITRLVRTGSSGWTEDKRSTDSMKIVDDGSGLAVYLEDEKKSTFALSYHEAEELFILLMQQEFSDIEIREVKTTMKWPLSQ
jgi:hypothetical protein